MEKDKGRPLKYWPLLEGLEAGDSATVWEGDSSRYSMKLTWELNTRKIKIPPGDFKAVRLENARGDYWMVRVTRTS